MRSGSPRDLEAVAQVLVGDMDDLRTILDALTITSCRATRDIASRVRLLSDADKIKVSIFIDWISIKGAAADNPAPSAGWAPLAGERDR